MPLSLTISWILEFRVRDKNKKPTKPNEMKQFHFEFRMEINDTTRSVYQACRWYGFVPYSLTRNKLNQIIDLKLSRPLCVYSILLVVFFCISIEYALFYDTYSGYSLR